MLNNLDAEFKTFLTRHPTAVISLIETKATPVDMWGLRVKFVDPSTTGFCNSFDDYLRAFFNYIVYLFL